MDPAWFLAAWLALPGVPKDVYTVALDPGHGGSVLGAQGVVPDLYEKNVTLDIARRVKTLLLREPGVRVLMCRDSDLLQPIRARVRCGNQSQARLFISIHANASPHGPTRGTQRGFELYVAPIKTVDDDAALAAHKIDDPADAAWAAHTIRDAAVSSLTAARRIQWRLSDALGRDRDRGIKQDGASLDVLQGLQIPGVLCEVGFLDHPAEGRELGSAEGRARIATAIAAAITDLAGREARGRRDPAITGRP